MPKLSTDERNFLIGHVNGGQSVKEITSKMPLCHLFTNIAASALKEGIESRLAQVISTTLKKPLERIVVVIVPGVLLFRRGSTLPACTVNLSSTERFNKDSNPTYTEPLMQAITQELEVPSERVVLIYQDLDKDMLATVKPIQKSNS